MDQNTIVLYLRMKGMSLDAIHEDLVRTLGTDAVTSSTVTKYARSAKFSPKKDRPSSDPPVVDSNPVDTRALPTDLRSSIHCAPAIEPLASLYNSAFAMAPLFVDRRAEADPGRHVP
jgi:hypothetical protein